MRWRWAAPPSPSSPQRSPPQQARHCGCSGSRCSACSGKAQLYYPSALSVQAVARLLRELPYRSSRTPEDKVKELTLCNAQLCMGERSNRGASQYSDAQIRGAPRRIGVRIIGKG